MKDIENDLKWLKNRLENFKGIKIHKSDINALNNIINYYNDSKIVKKTPTEIVVRKLLINIIANKIEADTHTGDDRNFGINITNVYLKGIISRLEWLITAPTTISVSRLTIAMNNMRLFNNLRLQKTIKMYDDDLNRTGMEVRKCDVDMKHFERIIRTEWKEDEVEEMVNDLLTQIFNYKL